MTSWVVRAGEDEHLFPTTDQTLHHTQDLQVILILMKCLFYHSHNKVDYLVHLSANRSHQLISCAVEGRLSELIGDWPVRKLKLRI